MNDIFDIRDYGAVPERIALNTEAFRKAIDAAAEVHGTVIVTGGCYRTGAIFLKSGMRLHIEKGSVIMGSASIADYPVRNTRFEGRTCAWPVALVNADGADGTVIDGEGCIDGNGIGFWKLFWDKRSYAVEHNEQFSNRDIMRPRLIFINSCRNILIKDISLQNSAFWNIHLYNSEAVCIDGISVCSPHEEVRAASSDAVDIDACSAVTVRNCNITTDDDCICIKGGKGPDAHLVNHPTENICIENCSFGFGHGMVTIGSEASLVRNVYVRNCRVDGRNNIIRFKFRDDTMQLFENIVFDGITVHNGRWLFDMQRWDNRQDESMSDGQLFTKLSNIIIRNIEAYNMESPGTIGGRTFTGVTENMLLEHITVTTAAVCGTEQSEGIDCASVEKCRLLVNPAVQLKAFDVKIDGTEFKNALT